MINSSSKFYFSFSLCVCLSFALLPANAQSDSSPSTPAGGLQSMQPVTDESQPDSSQAAPVQATPGQSEAGSGQADQASAKPLVLRGSAEMHAEALPPVDPSLQAGAFFNEQSIPKLQPNNDWYWIPSWYAGVKHIETQTILQDYDFRTGETINAQRTVLNRQDLPIGFQMDRNGQIWEFKRAPYEATTDSGGAFTKTFVRSREPMQVNQGVVVVKLVETSVMVNKQTNRIVRTLQEEQINTYTPLGGGAMNMKTSIKAFDANGRAQMLETSVRNATQVAPFQPINNYQGMDTRSMFRDFMIAKGMANLLPSDLAPPPPNNAYGNPYPQPMQGQPFPPAQPFGAQGYPGQLPLGQQPYPAPGFPLQGAPQQSNVQNPQFVPAQQYGLQQQYNPAQQLAPPTSAGTTFPPSQAPQGSAPPVVIDDPSAPPVAPSRAQ